MVRTLRSRACSIYSLPYSTLDPPSVDTLLGSTRVEAGEEGGGGRGAGNTIYSPLIEDP